MRLLATLVMCAFASTSSAFAQQRPGEVRLIISDAAIARALADQPPAPPRRQDSVVNGTFIGAVIGAAALGISGGVVCHLLREPSDPPCWKGVLRVSIIGGAIGAGAGAGIDALLDRRPGAFRTGSR